MGKKTDAQLKMLLDKSETCSKTSSSLKKVLDAWPAIDNEWDKWEAEMVRLPNWEDHPYAKKRIAVWQMGKTLSAKLKAEIHDLNMALAGFKMFVEKKEKSRNPFRSKNSLPSSKATIKLYDASLKALTDAAMAGSTAFH